MGQAGLVFAQPTTDPYKIGWWFSTRNQPITITDLLVRIVSGWSSVSSEPNYHWNPSKRGEISQDQARSCQIHPRFGEIPSDLARFLPNRDEKSLVRLDPVFIVTKIDEFK